MANHNIIKFPGAKNKEVEQMEFNLGKANRAIQTIMELDDWEQHPVFKEDLWALAQWGECMTFSKVAASRLIAILATKILVQQNERLDAEIPDFYHE